VGGLAKRFSCERKSNKDQTGRRSGSWDEAGGNLKKKLKVACRWKIGIRDSDSKLEASEERELLERGFE
jgi:hypothetical protein